MVWDSAGATLQIKGAITVTGGDAATQTYASGTAYTQATTAQQNAAADATSKANAAQSAAQSAAIAQASAYVTSLANGGWTAGNGTFITSTSISSPTIAGNAGYISGLFKVGSGGITLDGVNKRIYIGNGNFGNVDTGFYADNGGNFSLGNQLTFTGGNLAIAGAASIGGTTATTIANGAAAGASALQSGANITSLTNNAGYQDNNSAKTAGSVGGWTIAASSISANSGQTVLSNDGTIRLKDVNNVTKVSLNYDTTNATDPLNATAGTIPVRSISVTFTPGLN
jgi:hypothetical protein